MNLTHETVKRQKKALFQSAAWQMDGFFVVVADYTSTFVWPSMEKIIFCHTNGTLSI